MLTEGGTGKRLFENGAGNRIRTDDPRITNALLYQLSYPGIPLLCKGLEAVRRSAGHTSLGGMTVKILWPDPGFDAKGAFERK